MLKVINSQFHNFNPYSWIFHVSSPWTLVNNSLLGSDSKRQFGRDIYKYKVRQVYKNTTKNCNSSAPVPLLLLTHILDANLVVTNIFIKIKCPSFSRERENGGGRRRWTLWIGISLYLTTDSSGNVGGCFQTWTGQTSTPVCWPPHWTPGTFGTPRSRSALFWPPQWDPPLLHVWPVHHGKDPRSEVC